MRPVSGEDLVTAALQSSLARAQKNFKLSNYKQLKSGECGKPRKGGVGLGRNSNDLKFHSEFDLWIEQASEVTFTSEGFTNGATIPKDIECLNSSSTACKAQNVKNIVPGEGVCGITNLKGKDKSKTAIGTRNSFEILKQLKENSKEKKKLAKLRKRLLKEGSSVEEVEKIIQEAKSGGGVGAIQKLKQTGVTSGGAEGKENLFLTKKQPDGKKVFKMKDLMENGHSSSATPRPETPSVHTSASSSTLTSSPARNGGSCSSSGNNSSNSSQGHQLPQPKRILYPRDKITPGYIEKMPVGAGFYNMGNSCYLNASLQAVFHVPAFINWLKHDAEHRKHCQDNMNCIVCAMKKTLDSAMNRQSSAPSAIRPVEIINRLRSICRHFSHGRQEDAHEFLRYLFESMERSYLAAINCLRLDNRSKETNPLGQIFGGYLRTEVTCLKCHYVSTTFQPTAELQLDIRHVTTLEDALMNHFKKERLDNNDYKCEKCRTISQATKQFSLEMPPVVLCLQLKRFTLYGTKIAKRIHCNRILNMSKYMHKSKQANGCSDLRYRLVALVTHLGSSPNCGHYTAIAEASNGHFYQFDDSYVHQVTVANALNNDAYVIIYEMDRRTLKSPESSASSTSNYSTNVSNSSYPSSTVTSSTSSSYTNSIFPKTPNPKVPPFQSKLVQGCEKESKSALTNGSISSSSESVNGTTNSQTALGSRLNTDRKVISFGLRSPVGGGLCPPKKINILRPGVSLTNSSKLPISPTSSGNSSNNGSSPSATASKENKSDHSVKLVPYNDDENEESDKDGGRVFSNGKRLKHRDTQSPVKNPELPITPPKSPKAARTSPSSDRALSVENKLPPESITASKGENSSQKDAIKRKAPTEEDTPRKSRPHSRRRSSSSSSATSTSSLGNKESSKSKRKRDDFSKSSERKSSYNSSDNRRDREHRESHSQERDRERRRDRNPSRSPSVDNDKNRRGSSNDMRRAERADGSAGTSESNAFDVSRLKRENTGWDGQTSLLSRSMEEDRKRSSEKSLGEEYDDEFDEGRTKKVRRSRSLPRETESAFGNRFQNVEDRKKQITQWTSLLDGNAPGFRRSGGGSLGGTESKNWSNGDDVSKQKRNFLPRPNSSGNIVSRPRHSSSHSGSNFSGSQGRSPFRNGHHSSNGGNGHYRSQSHGFYHNSSTGKHWSNNNDRNRH